MEENITPSFPLHRLPLPLPPPYISPFTLTPFPPPTTPTTSHHRRKRSKLLRIDSPPPPPPHPSSSTTTTPTATSETATRTPSRKPDPLAPKITRPCTECGKTFWSWKALFGHMRCHPERQWRGINPPPNLRRTSPPPHPPSPHTPSADDREVAASLLLLASSTGDDHTNVPVTMARFECSSCKKTFPSHQALGGHRASHKNVKGCFAITKSGADEEEGINAIVEGQNGHFSANIEEMDLGLGLVLGLGHRCWVCFKVFTSGQALGGHMRCHWEKNEQASTSSLGLGPITPIEAQYGLDLNLPAQVLEEDVGPPVCSASSLQLDLRLGI